MKKMTGTCIYGLTEQNKQKTADLKSFLETKIGMKQCCKV